tara:strand:- start:5260 stop:6096 length:837 start_codon:yes stop_codon:yes gene_type:complete
MQRPSGLESQTMINNAKYEYLYILHNIMNDPLYNRFQRLYNESEDLYDFQQKLKLTKEWNKTQINDVVSEILSDIDWDTSDFDDLITAIFIGHSMTLTSINLKNTPDNFKLRVPSNETLVHTILQTVAQKLFYDPYIFKMENYENYEKVSKIIEGCLKKSIVSLLPIKELVKYSIENKDSDSDNVFNLPNDNDQTQVVNNTAEADSDSDFNPDDQEQQTPIDPNQSNDNGSDSDSDSDIKNIQYNSTQKQQKDNPIKQTEETIDNPAHKISGSDSDSD